MSHRSVLYEITIDLATGRWGVDCPLDQSLVGPVQYGWDRFQKDPEQISFALQTIVRQCRKWKPAPPSGRRNESLSDITDGKSLRPQG